MRPSARCSIRPGELLHSPGPRSLTARLGLPHDSLEPLGRVLSVFTNFLAGRHIEFSVIVSPLYNNTDSHLKAP